MPLPFLDNFFAIDINDFRGSLEKIRQKYGETHTIWLFGSPVVLINKLSDIRKYFLGEYGEATSGRPDLIIFDILYGRKNVGIVNSTGEIWRDTRRFSLHTLRDFGVGKAVMEVAIREEGEAMLRRLDKESALSHSGEVDPTESLAVAITNVVSRVMFGHPFPDGDPRPKEIRDALAGVQNIGGNPAVAALSIFPSLRHVPLFGHFGADLIEEFGRRLWSLVDAEIASVQRTFDPANEPSNFVEAYLKEMEERKRSGKDLNDMSVFQLSRTLGDFWTAGFETTLTTMRWAPVFLTNFPEAQAKIHAELDEFYGLGLEGKPVEMGDRTHLPYTTAAVMELQRLANILPFNVQHSLLKDLNIDGYHIPKGTTIVPQITSVLHDSELFPEPRLYKPERFLDEEGKLKVTEAFLPFSLGKRACAGEPLARAELFIFFVQILREFKISARVLPPMKPIPGAAIKPFQYSVAFTRRYATSS